MGDRFDLEENILQCWTVVEELKLFRENFSGLTNEDRDTYIHGIELMYENKFQKLWDVFEKMVHEKQFTSMNHDSHIHVVHLDDFDELNDGYST
jgi:hypothetical protein